MVLEIKDGEYAADLQARLDKAAEDGFFLVNVVGRLAFLRTTVTQKKPESQPLVDNTPVNSDAITVIGRALAGRTRVSLRELRRTGHFDKLPEKEWYRALQSMVESGSIVTREETSAGGHIKTVVLVKGVAPSSILGNGPTVVKG